ncbi:MAG: SpoIIE family protein phosphatase [Candidatus Zixiibacteriota bacterium]|nr:MAG: SpoIIE family protein phosphatase [candidate division Zixibacteria bacterium]
MKDKTENKNLEISDSIVAEKEELLADSFKVLSSDLDLDAVIRNSLGIIFKRFQAEAACLFLIDLHNYKLKSCCAGSGSPDRMHILPLENESQIAGWDRVSRKPYLLDDLKEDSDFSRMVYNYLNFYPKSIIGIPLYKGGEFLGVIQAINSDKKHFTDKDLELLRVLAERVAITLRNAWILQEATRVSDEARSLYEVGIALSGSLELDELLDKILENLAKVIECDIAMIYLVDPEKGTINQIATRGLDDFPPDQLHLKIGQGICGRVAETGKGVIVSDVDKNSDYIACRTTTRSEMAVPLKVKDAVVGVLNVESDKKDAYKNHELELMNAFASLAAVSVERAKLHKQMLSARRLEHELAIARRIQKTFLPSGNPRIDGFDIAGLNLPSAEMGGDYYDFIPIVENQYGIAIGDVSGNGIPASLIMAAFRASLKAEIRNNFAIRAILNKVNNLLFESIERDRYVTATYGVLDCKNKIFTFSNAGHNHPILLRGSGDIQFLEEGGMALGIFANSTYEENSVFLKSGDIVLFYTDGVTEVKDEDEVEFGEQRLIDAVKASKQKSAAGIINYIIKEIEKFEKKRRFSDDITLIVMKTL